MSVTPNEIVIYGAANMPEADTGTVGGAIDLTKRVSFYDIPATGKFDLVSSATADTATKCQISGRDATGAIVTSSVITLTGQTLLANSFGGQNFERLLAGVVSGGAIAGLSDPTGTAATGDIAVMANSRTISAHTAQAGSANKSGTTPPLFKLQSGDGATIGALTYQGVGLIIYITNNTPAGALGQLRMITVPYSAGAYGTDVVAINQDWGFIPTASTTYDIAYGMLFDKAPNQVKAITRIFATAQADVPGGSTRSFYEKLFVVNTNAATALTSTQVQVLSETPTLPAGAALDMVLTKSLTDTNTITNRLTVPLDSDSSSFTFLTQPTPITVPNASSPGTLPASGQQAMWLRLQLNAGTTVYKGAADIRTTGGTT